MSSPDAALRSVSPAQSSTRCCRSRGDENRVSRNRRRPTEAIPPHRRERECARRRVSGPSQPGRALLEAFWTLDRDPASASFNESLRSSWLARTTFLRRVGGVSCSTGRTAADFRAPHGSWSGIISAKGGSSDETDPQRFLSAASRQDGSVGVAGKIRESLFPCPCPGKRR